MHYQLDTDNAVEEEARGDWRALAAVVHADNVAKGFWPEKIEERNFGELLALILSEIAEIWEAHFTDGMDDKLPDWPAVWTEVADTIIRILDVSYAHDIDLDGEVVEFAAVRSYTSLSEDLQDISFTLCRALEAHRKNLLIQGQDTMQYKVEIATAFGLLLSLMEKLSIPLGVIDAKLAFNRTRPFKHGKLY